MFSSGWLYKFALGGCLAALLIFPTLASDKENNAPQKAQTQKTDEGQQTPAPQPPPLPAIDGEKPVETDWNKVECAKPKNHDEADLCEQRRMSQAAENGVDLSKIQIALGILGATLVLWSLYYTRVAAIAAKDAANSALESALTAGKQADAIIRAERPYVFLKVTKPGLAFTERGMIIPDTDGRLRFEFVNYGRTPAMLEEFMEAYPVVEGRTDAPAPVDPMKIRGRMLPVGTVAATSAPYALRTNLFTQAPDIRKMMDKDACQLRRIFFQGFIRYSDAFGNHYITGFLEAFSPVHGEWALRGDEKHNYSRQERPEEVRPHPDYIERPDPDSESA
jgi:hypothetical protein